MEDKKPQSTHTLQELFDAMSKETVANRICYRSNIFKVYMEKQSKDILKFVVQHLATTDPEQIQGYGATLTHLIKAFALTPERVFQTVNDEINPMRDQVKCGHQKYCNLVCILSCLQACYYAGCQEDPVVRLYQQAMANKIGPVDAQAESLVFKTINQLNNFNFCQDGGQKVMKNFFGLQYQMSKNQKIEDEVQFQRAIEQVVNYKDQEQFCAVLQQYLSQQSNYDQIQTVFDVVLRHPESTNSFVSIVSTLASLRIDDEQQYTQLILNNITKLLSEDQRFLRLAAEASNPRAPYQKVFIEMFDNLFGIRQLSMFYVNRISLLQSYYFYVIKPVQKTLVDNLNEQSARVFITNLLKVCGQSTNYQQFLSLILQVSRQLDTQSVLELIQLLLRYCGVNVEAVAIDQSKPQLALDFTPQADYQKVKESMLRLAWQVIINQNEAGALIKQLSEQIIEIKLGNDPYYDLLSQLARELKQFKLQYSNTALKEIGDDAEISIQNYTELFYQYVLLLTIQPQHFKDPLLNSLVLELFTQIQKSAELIASSSQSQQQVEEEYDQIQNMYFTALGRFTLKLSQKESQIVKDYACKIVKNASLNCSDDLFTAFIVGLDPAQNANFINGDQEADEDADESEKEAPETSESNQEHNTSKDMTETDQFVFTQEKVIKDSKASCETANDSESGEEFFGYCEDEEEKEEESEISKPAEPELKEEEKDEETQQNDEDYDRMLANAVRDAIRQQSESPLKLNLNVALKSVTFLEILCQNNPERPVVWEVIFSLLQIGANPLGNLQVNPDEEQEEFHANEAELTSLLQQKCLSAVRKELLQSLSVNYLFDTETNTLVAQEDVNMLMELVQSKNNAQKAAAGVVLGFIIKNLGKQTDDVSKEMVTIQLELQESLVVKIVDMFCDKQISLNRSFLQQLLSNEQMAEQFITAAIKKVKVGTDAYILVKLQDMVPIMQFAQKPDQYKQRVFDVLIQQLNILVADQSKKVNDATHALNDLLKLMKPTEKFIADLKQVPARAELMTVFSKIAKTLKGLKK